MKNIKTIVGTAALLTALFSAVPAMAFGLGGAARSMGSQIEFIALKSRTVAPFAHVMLCAQRPQECTGTASDQTVALTPSKRRMLTAVNYSVNRKIKPQNDSVSSMGGDIWSINPAAGDCDDYAVTKRHALIQRGWPSSALRLAVAHTPRGEGHLVLIVKTSDGDLVLDNLTNRVKKWYKTGLRWEKVQSAENPRIWYSM